MGSKGSRPDPLARSDADWERDVKSGKIADFKKTDSGGIQVFKKTSDGAIKVAHLEREDNDKGHRETDFIIRNGFITEIRPHND